MNTDNRQTRTDEKVLVSVSMITYNHEKYIARALDSVLMQKVNFRYEIVVGEDCSTDGTRAILLDYKKKHPDKFNLILHEKNVGAMRNSQAVDKACRGEYIAMLEGDDYWSDPCKLQIQIDEMRKYPECHMSFHSAMDVWEDNSRPNEVTTKRAKGNRLFSTKEVIHGGGAFCPTASLMFKSEVIKTLPQWCYEAPVGDYFLQILGSLHGGALYIDRTMSVYRRNAEGSWSMGNTNAAKREKFLKEVLVTFDHLDRHLNHAFNDEIDIRRSEVYLKQATLYLEESKFDKFLDAITQSYRLSHYKSANLYTCYYLRKFPTVLQKLGEVQSLIKKKFHPVY